ncbi:type II toxin-antitoxin system prevent-host-death family antitoxin [Planomonospora sp. ID82291]|uniref:type II toxin-antitoxin system prevent-host-death family antitoxin n=1 Tax=Planomonospora sp. ID82291 TaxID=2738136 RepID=UPI0018C40192|nr:type II toxin-antitoxin system prevent-host-death family antitoxin [Planomonospora sp. ID82291]MBG0817621.1 type II toxin-antitoxin system prevent-host-death family antitoxin [Planomonospora sp. ID82291]
MTAWQVQEAKQRFSEVVRRATDEGPQIVTRHGEEVAEEWGRLNAVRPLPTADGLIAATARVNGWTLVSRNVEDFEGTGVSVVDPFASYG